MRSFLRNVALRRRRQLVLLPAVLLGAPRFRNIGKTTLLTYERALSNGIRLRVRVGVKSDEMVIDEVYVQKVYEREFPLVKGNVVVDVGANIGAFSVRASRLVGDEGKVLAIEPEKENFLLLRENLAGNKCRNVQSICLGLGEEPGMAGLNVYKRRGSHSLFDNPGETLVRRDLIRIETLDNITKQFTGGRIDFLKIDAEGAEQIILRGGEASILRSRPRIAMETHMFASSTDNMTTFLSDLGYQVKHQRGVHGQGLLYAH